MAILNSREVSCHCALRQKRLLWLTPELLQLRPELLAPVDCLKAWPLQDQHLPLAMTRRAQRFSAQDTSSAVDLWGSKTGGTYVQLPACHAVWPRRGGMHCGTKNSAARKGTEMRLSPMRCPGPHTACSEAAAEGRKRSHAWRQRMQRPSCFDLSELIMAFDASHDFTECTT